MPEKGLSQVSRPDRELYEKGRMALERQNWDYAIAILNQVLQHEPAFYDCRQALRAAQFKKAGANPGLMRKIFGSATSSPQLAKVQLLLRSNPLEAIKTIEGILNQDPNNVGAHRLLAEAALAADFPKTAVLSLEIALKNSPNDREIALTLGEALTRSGQIERAELVLTELEKACPNDSEISQVLKNIAARRTMKEGGYDALTSGSGSYRDILKDKEEAVLLEQQNREFKSEDVISRLIAEQERRIPLEPKNLKLLRTLGELYSQKNEFGRALEYYQKIIEVEGSHDPSLDKLILETKIKQLDQQIAALDPGQADAAAKIAQLQKQKVEIRLAECQQRAEKYPSDLQIRFELGGLYFEAGKLNEAIQEFQRAQANPHRHIQALLYLGRCFAQRGMYDLATRKLQSAIDEKLVFDEEMKELLYNLGVTYEKMGKSEQAVEAFKRIYEIDIGYKNVAQKVDSYYASR